MLNVFNVRKDNPVIYYWHKITKQQHTNQEDTKHQISQTFFLAVPKSFAIPSCYRQCTLFVMLHTLNNISLFQHSKSSARTTPTVFNNNLSVKILVGKK